MYIKKMSIYTTGSTNFLGSSTKTSTSSLGDMMNFGDAPLNEHTKMIPKTYAVANWVLTRALQDDIELPTESLFRFNLGRTAPWPLTVNARSQCTMFGNKDVGVPPSQFYCPGCGPNPYTPDRYRPNM